MTRTEAIRVLQHIVRWGIISDEKMKEALIIAINSLKVDEMYQLEKEDADEFISKKVIEDIRAELWDSGMNMTGEYQGIWVRYRDIEQIFDKHINGKDQNENSN